MGGWFEKGNELSKAGYPQPKDEVVGGSCILGVISCQFSALLDLGKNDFFVFL